MRLARTVRLVLLSASAWCAVAAIKPALADPASDQVSRGKYLVDAGDCAACHTKPGGPELAGGYPLNTPFGVMYTPNITPDKDTGIGNWTDDQFFTLFHEGRGPGGQYVYPGFPYRWFTHVTRDDALAIKAYLFTLPPVHAPKPANKLMFPLNIRFSVAGWNLLFFKPEDFQPDPHQSAQVNRGAYLAEGLAHCGDCHTPKNVFQAPINSQKYAGGIFDKWYAPNISSDPQGIGSWSDDELFHYLKTGVDPKRGVVLGPMAETIRYSLARLTDSDVHDIVAYLKTVPAQASYKPRSPVLASDQRPGAAIYASYCAECHQPNGQGVSGKIPALADNGAVTAKGPQNVIRVVLGGLRAQGSYGPMPGWGTIMNDQQIADVTNYVRGAWSNQAPESATADEVSAAAKETRSILALTQTCPPQGSSPLDAVLVDPASGIPAIMQATDEQNVLQSVNKIAAIVKAKAPGSQQADIVNEATDAYCPVLAADTSLQPEQRWERLNQFGESLYTQLTTKGKD
jgi:mono/diheme cytochrome c family protein